MIAISANNSYKIRQMNVITASHYRFFDKEIYIIQLTMFEDGTMRVYLFKKALYGLKQSLRVYYQILFDFLKKHNFYKT